MRVTELSRLEVTAFWDSVPVLEWLDFLDGGNYVVRSYKTFLGQRMDSPEGLSSDSNILHFHRPLARFCGRNVNPISDLLFSQWPGFISNSVVKSCTSTSQWVDFLEERSYHVNILHFHRTAAGPDDVPVPGLINSLKDADENLFPFWVSPVVRPRLARVRTRGCSAVDLSYFV
jgi:hypothetical protein